MNTFGRSAGCYDQLYEEKDYVAEAAYIDRIIKKYAAGSESILDLGCGTGRHALQLASNGYTIVGVDRSQGMLLRADAEREKLSAPVRERLLFREYDIRTARLGEQFDVVVALFHVISYQISNEDVLATFATVSTHLRPQGLFIFDFWYGPGVLRDPPTVRVKRAEDKKRLVLRVADPIMQIHENTVDVRYLFIEVETALGSYQEFSEAHKMRYFFQPELRLFMQYTGLKPLRLVEWMTDNGVSPETWSATFIAQRDG